MPRHNWLERSPKSRMMSSALRSLVVYLNLSAALFTVPSCAFALGRKPPALDQPPAELCILGDSGCVCFDPRLPVGQQTYIRKYGAPESSGGCLNYQATNITDYNAKQDWIRQNCWGKPKENPR